ncbi:MAG: hypothetical protein U5K31_14745 [Balneolaceae bacterium]|nr:hypothetical protein [Balneolaceae bacterium]
MRAAVLILLISVAVGAVPQEARGQDGGGYELLPAPDLWYNDVDGIRLGIRLRGQVPGTFQDGPHRLDLGVWLGTWWPEHPLSYYLSLTEPIPSLSAFNSEASVRLESSIRTGLHRHRISFNKRWQPGFDEMTYRELSVFGRVERRYDTEYQPFRNFWNTEWMGLAGASLQARGSHGGGPWLVHGGLQVSVAREYGDPFARFTAELQQRLDLGEPFALHARLFGGFAGEDVPPQYRFLRSMRSPAGWADQGLTRAKGTIPQAWLTDGFIQVGGGPNLRGYTWRDIGELNQASFSEGEPGPLFRSVSSLNLELQFPNPLDQLIKETPIIGELLELRSYLFFDAGASLNREADLHPDGNLLADAGPGFMLSLNIPDYLGKPRGIMIRYDLPLWLSRPGQEKAFKFRNIIGLGAVISL